MPRQIMPYALAAASIIGLALLAGCAAAPPPIVQTRIEVERVTIPPPLLTCMAAPPVPVHAKLQSQVADWITRATIADDTCRTALAEIATMQGAKP
jgi:hypothetical protein